MNSSEFKTIEKQLTSLGFGEWFQENYTPNENFSFARIIEVNRGNYVTVQPNVS